MTPIEIPAGTGRRSRARLGRTARAARAAGLLAAAGALSAACGTSAGGAPDHPAKVQHPTSAHLAVQPAHQPSTPAPKPAPKPSPKPAPAPKPAPKPAVKPAPKPAPAPVLAPAAGNWHSSQLTISVQGLGAVRIGMTLAAAEQAAGAEFDGSGDGYRYPMTGFFQKVGERFVGMRGGFGPSGGDVYCVGAWGHSAAQSVSTPEGISIGEATEEIPEVYGSRATYVPAPAIGGMTDYGGWVVSEDGGTIVFLADQSGEHVAGIMAGGPGLGPNSCTG